MIQGLIISRERTAVESLRSRLGDGCLLKDFGTVAEGQRELVSRPLDFVLLDARSGEGDRLADLLDLLAVRPELPVLAVVPALDSSLAAEFSASGAYAVLGPPLASGPVVETIRRAAEKNRRQRELEFQTRTRPPLPPVAGPVPAEDNRHFHREVIRRFFKALAQVCDHRRLLELAVEAIVETFNAGQAIILLFDSGAGCYRPRAEFGYSASADSVLRFPPGDPLPAWLVRQSRVIVAADLSRERDYEIYRQVSLLDAEIVCGLFSQGNLLGILGVGKRITGKVYGADEIELLSLLVNYLAMAIENSLLYRDIARNQAHNEKVLNFLPAGVITVDSRGVVTTINRAAVAILGLDRDEVIGERVEKIGSRLADLFHRTLRENVKQERLELPSPRGRRPLGVSLAPVLDEEGRVCGALMVMADLTRIKAMEEKEKDRARLEFASQMAARLAHELKNPMVAIKTFAQLLPRQFDEPEFRENFSRIVVQEVDRLDNIVAQIAKLARLPRLERQPVDIREVIDSALQAQSSRREEKKISLVRELGAEQLPVRADPRLLEEAFSQIVVNAIEALPESGTIRVSAGLHSGGAGGREAVEVVFRDDGPGIPPEELENVFTPFYSSGNETLGLGLSIARQVVSFHGGEIELKAAPGRGTLVRVVIPAADISCYCGTRFAPSLRSEPSQ